jgi:N-methylhydantoinase A/oxoprolinase/acetone carboxylase beta subunit
LIHATTLIANTLIERKGAHIGLLTTLGFEDVLELRTESRYDHYDLFLEYPPPLVQRSLRIGINERVGPHGQLISVPDTNAIKEAVGQFSKAGVEPRKRKARA